MTDFNNGESNIRSPKDNPLSGSHDDNCNVLEEEVYGAASVKSNKISCNTPDGTNSFGEYRNSKPTSVTRGASLAFVANPSVAELSQITALKMVRNFQELSEINDKVRFFFYKTLNHLICPLNYFLKI